ncbi:phage tail fiber protein [Paenibacillus cymbidii]|uniref:phage tail fiber protein n=1 Tax=Paenibacillus cymbidii TaxID=1639034 RepID=UPI00108123AD|nr:hypothetical protein [Paenibacillus cymbidii]
MSLSNYAENAVINALFRNTAFTPPTTLYIALYTSDPTDADTGTEVTGGSYSRQTVTFDAPSQVGGKARIVNSADRTFPTATADWGTVTHFGIRDALTAGNLLGSAALSNQRTVLQNDVLKFLQGELKIDID